MAACVGTRDDEELKELFDNAESFDLSFFSNNTVAEFVKHFISTGTLHDARVLQMRLKRLLGNATFLQAFQHSGGSHAQTDFKSGTCHCETARPHPLCTSITMEYNDRP